MQQSRFFADMHHFRGNRPYIYIYIYIYISLCTRGYFLTYIKMNWVAIMDRTKSKCCRKLNNKPNITLGWHFILKNMYDLLYDPLCETQLTSSETFLNGYSVKTMLYKSPSSILHCIRLLGENIAGQSYRVSQKRGLIIQLIINIHVGLFRCRQSTPDNQ